MEEYEYLVWAILTPKLAEAWDLTLDMRECEVEDAAKAFRDKPVFIEHAYEDSGYPQDRIGRVLTFSRGIDGSLTVYLAIDERTPAGQLAVRDVESRVLKDVSISIRNKGLNGVGQIDFVRPNEISLVREAGNEGAHIIGYGNRRKLGLTLAVINKMIANSVKSPSNHNTKSLNFKDFVKSQRDERKLITMSASSLAAVQDAASNAAAANTTGAAGNVADPAFVPASEYLAVKKREAELQARVLAFENAQKEQAMNKMAGEIKEVTEFLVGSEFGEAGAKTFRDNIESSVDQPGASEFVVMCASMAKRAKTAEAQVLSYQEQTAKNAKEHAAHANVHRLNGVTPPSRYVYDDAANRTAEPDVTTNATIEPYDLKRAFRERTDEIIANASKAHSNRAGVPGQTQISPGSGLPPRDDSGVRIKSVNIAAAKANACNRRQEQFGV